MDAASPWYVPLARAVPALALAAVITFSADHSARLGLVTFGLFAVLSGAVILVAALRSARAGVDRGLTGLQGAIAIMVGVASLVVPGAGLPYLVFLLTAFTVLTGFLELYLGLRARRNGAVAARDRIFLGGLTVLLAVVVLLVPPEFVQSFTGPDGVARQLTAAVIVVGLLGAYWAIAGVYLVIAALSLKWDGEPHRGTTSPANGGA